MTKLSSYLNKNTLSVILTAGSIFIGLHIFYQIMGFSFVENTDCSWYRDTALNLGGFDPAAQPLYPAISAFLNFISAGVFGLEATMIFVSFIFYLLTAAVIAEITKLINGGYKFWYSLFLLMFPILGIFLNILPRANPMLNFFYFMVAYQVLKGDYKKAILFWMVLPLIHKSSLLFIPPVAIFILIKNWRHIYIMLLSAIPTVIYIVLGTTKHESFFWWFEGYDALPPVLGLPVADGLFGTIYLGISEHSTTKAIQGIIMLIYAVLSLYAIVNLVKSKNIPYAVFLFPVVLLSLILPAAEINSLLNYSFFSMVPFLFFMHTNFHAVFNKYLKLIVIGLILTNIGWLYHTYFYYTQG